MTSRTNLGGLLLASICLSVALASPVPAHLQERSDEDSTPGPLDLRRATFSHPESSVRSTLTTQGDWNAQTLTNGSQLLFDYDSRGDGFGDFYVRVRGVNGSLQGRLFEGGDPLDGGGEPAGSVNVHRDGRTLVVRFLKTRIDPRPGYIGWAAISKYKGSPACSNGKWGCFDVMPDGTYYEHNL